MSAMETLLTSAIQAGDRPTII